MAEALPIKFNNLYAVESARQNSFIMYNWPKSAPVWPILLVRAGFYYKGNDLEVQCFSCGIKTTVADWTRNVHPQQMHFKLNPDCEFIREQIEPDGGPKTFNDQEKWQRDLKDNSTDCNIISHDIKYEEDGQIKSENNFRTEDQNQDSLARSRLEIDSAPISNADSGLGTSHNSQIAVTTGSTRTMVSYDSGQPGTFSRDNLLISGSYSPYQFRTTLDSVQSTPVNTEPSTVEDMEHDANDSSLSQEVTYKHPEMETILSRMDTFQTWPLTTIQDPKNLVMAGLFYTYEHDVVRCFCCDLGLSEWDIADDPWTEHARHSPNCWYLKRVKGQQYIDQVQEDWKRIYSPKFPNLIDEAARLSTFNNWPNRVPNPTVVDIAKAGFFFTGRNDECRCHYCDGGLQHWEEGDLPWEQHAYYFPFCKFVIKMKGREYINMIRERFEERGPNVDALIRESEEVEAAMTREDVRDRRLREILAKEEFRDLTSWGYSKRAIKMAAEEVFRETGNFDFKAEQVINKLVDLQENGEELPNDDDDDTEEAAARPREPLLPAAEFMKQLEQEETVGDANKVLAENKKLKERLLCWKCGKNEICMLFTPCGHRLTCEDCGKDIHHCLKCKKKVKKRYKTFLA